MNKRVLSIDPGPTESAYVYGDVQNLEHPIIESGKVANSRLLDLIRLRRFDPKNISIEEIVCYGMPVGAETFRTARLIGRLEEIVEQRYGFSPLLVPKPKMSAHLCLNRKARDVQIRQRLIDLYGPGRKKAIGRKSAPGPLYGVATDVWLALAHAVYLSEVTTGELKAVCR